MKVLQINSVCGIGSTGRIATDIHNILVKSGHESYIAYGRDLPKNCDNAIEIGGKYDNYSHVALTRILDKHGFGSKNATLKFIKEMEELNPDVIHLHNIHGYYLNVELLFDYLKRANKPIIWTLHDCWSFTGHCSYFDFVNCNKWISGCNNCPQKKEYPASLLIDNSKKNYIRKKEIFTGVKNLTIVTPSKWLAGLVKESYLSEYPVKVINNGIDLEVFKPTNGNFRERYGLQNKFIILGVASIWERRKGYKYFLELSKKLKSDEIIVLVGLNEEQIENLPDNIVGIKRTNSATELAEIYSSSDVFFNPTLEDNFPTTNLEALACGLPIITFNTGGSVEAVDEKTGFVVDKENINKVLVYISNIKKQEPISRRNCVSRSIKLYNKLDRFQDYISLYQDSLKLNKI